MLTTRWRRVLLVLPARGSSAVARLLVLRVRAVAAVLSLRLRRALRVSLLVLVLAIRRLPRRGRIGLVVRSPSTRGGWRRVLVVILAVSLVLVRLGGLIRRGAARRTARGPRRVIGGRLSAVATAAAGARIRVAEVLALLLLPRVSPIERLPWKYVASITTYAVVVVPVLSSKHARDASHHGTSDAALLVGLSARLSAVVVLWGLGLVATG